MCVRARVRAYYADIEGAYIRTLPEFLPYALVYSQILRGFFQQPESRNFEWCHHSEWVERARYCVIRGNILPFYRMDWKNPRKTSLWITGASVGISTQNTSNTQRCSSVVLLFRLQDRIQTFCTNIPPRHSGYPLIRWRHHKGTKQRIPWPP
jgi:hypothetical protein